MHLTAAFFRPDFYLSIVDTAIAIRMGQVFEIYVIQIDVAAISLAISMHGAIAILDFHITADLMNFSHFPGPCHN